MPKALGLGERGDVIVTPQRRDADGKWKTAPSGRAAERWRARVYFRGFDGVKADVTRVGKTRRDAVAAVEAAFTEALSAVGDVEMTAGMPLVKAGELWLTGIRRTDSRLAPRTVEDYGRTWQRYIDKPGASLRGLSLAEANSTQRLRTFLQEVADRHGTQAGRITRSVLMGVLNLAVDNGTLPVNALRNVRAIQAQTVKPPRAGREPRDPKRAFTDAELAHLIDTADKLAVAEGIAPQTTRKQQAVADLARFMADTGCRFSEARSLR